MQPCRPAQDRWSIPGTSRNENVNRPENGNFEDALTVRLKFLLLPDALPGFEALPTLTTGENDYGVPWVNAAQPPPYDNREVTFNDPTYEFTETDMGVLRLTYDLTDHWSLTSTTAWSDVRYGYKWDGDAGPEPDNTLYDDRDDDILSQELLANFDFERLTAVVGNGEQQQRIRDARTGSGCGYPESPRQ